MAEKSVKLRRCIRLSRIGDAEMIQPVWIEGLHAPDNISITYLAVAILDDTEPP
jgi:hypothetical protein